MTRRSKGRSNDDARDYIDVLAVQKVTEREAEVAHLFASGYRNKLSLDISLSKPCASLTQGVGARPRGAVMDEIHRIVPRGARDPAAGGQKEREPMAPTSHQGRRLAPRSREDGPGYLGASREAAAHWTRADIDRLALGDKPTWERALALIDAEALRRAWGLATVEAEAVQDHVVDTLLADGMRRLREIRDPSRFVGYLRAVAKNRARHVVGHRVKVLPLGDLPVSALAVADARRHRHPLSAEAKADRIALAQAVLRFRRSLTDRQFRIVWIYNIEGVSMRRIASAAKVARQTVSEAHRTAIAAIERARSRPGL